MNRNIFAIGFITYGAMYHFANARIIIGLIHLALIYWNYRRLKYEN